MYERVFRLVPSIRISADRASSLFVSASLLDVTDTVDSHVVFGDEGGDFQLIHVDDIVQVLNARYRMNFVFDGRGHEC